jgi:hypothetical protein
MLDRHVFIQDDTIQVLSLFLPTLLPHQDVFQDEAHKGGHVCVPRQVGKERRADANLKLDKRATA